MTDTDKFVYCISEKGFTKKFPDEGEKKKKERGGCASLQRGTKIIIQTEIPRENPAYQDVESEQKEEWKKALGHKLKLG